MILPVNVHQLKRSHLWYECGLDHDNSRAFYDITRLAAAIPFKMALPGIYGFTGTDYTPSFFRKGKVRPLKLMLKHQKFIDAFSSLGEGPMTLEVCSIIEECVCHLYGFNQLTSLADGVLAQFENKCRPKLTGEPLSAIKSSDALEFMPCLPCMAKQIDRAWYIACLYKEASFTIPCSNYTPLDFGWKLSNDKERLVLDWFDGDQIPCTLEDTEITSSITDSDDENDTCDSSDDENLDIADESD